METIFPKDLEKGDKVMLKNGWWAEVKAKAKGIRIFLEVHGFETELGDTYTRDLSYRIESSLKPRAKIVIAPVHQKIFAKIGGWF